MIDLYTSPTPNGYKVSCTLEAMNMDYKAHLVNLAEGEQKKPEFLAISANARIPAIVDRDNDNLAIFESGAIMIYLAEKSGKFLPSDTKGRARVIQWLMFRYFPEKIQPAIDRYQNEGRRLFEVLDTQLAKSEWLADDYSIADIANWCWTRTHKWSGISVEGLDNLARWNDAMYKQPGMLEGIKVPVSVDNILSNDKKMKEFADRARKNLQT